MSCCTTSFSLLLVLLHLPTLLLQKYLLCWYKLQVPRDGDVLLRKSLQSASCAAVSGNHNQRCGSIFTLVLVKQVK
jgi:hypothetical protein